mgnify:CR=1 FL=1
MKYTEIYRLKDKLQKRKIPFEFRKEFDGFQIIVNYDGIYVSIIEHFGSYGAQENLLEMWDYHSDPVGWMTAEDCLKKIEFSLEKKQGE